MKDGYSPLRRNIDQSQLSGNAAYDLAELELDAYNNKIKESLRRLGSSSEFSGNSSDDDDEEDFDRIAGAVSEEQQPPEQPNIPKSQRRRQGFVLT